MHGRTVILVSHHIQLCAPGASYIVALDNGRIQFQGDRHSFQASGVMDGLVQSGQPDTEDDNGEVTFATIEETIPDELSMQSSSAVSHTEPDSDTSSTAVSAEAKRERRKVPRVQVGEEKRAVGRVSRNVWKTYILVFGNSWSWILFIMILVLAALGLVMENWWLKCVFLDFYLLLS
jgi:ABC-type multidrug transport system ATPase subunit